MALRNVLEAQHVPFSSKVEQLSIGLQSVLPVHDEPLPLTCHSGDAGGLPLPGGDRACEGPCFSLLAEVDRDPDLCPFGGQTDTRGGMTYPRHCGHGPLGLFSAHLAWFLSVGQRFVVDSRANPLVVQLEVGYELQMIQKNAN